MFLNPNTKVANIERNPINKKHEMFLNELNKKIERLKGK